MSGVTETHGVIIAALLTLGVGVVVCFFGERLLKLVLGLLGFLAGAVAATGLALLLSSGAELVLLVAGLVGGVIGALLLVWAFRVGVFLVGATGGVLLAGPLGAGLSGAAQVAVIGALAIVGGVLALRLRRVVVGLATAIIGAALMVGAGLEVALGPAGARALASAALEGGALGHAGWIALGSWVLICLVGVGVQLGGANPRRVTS